MDCDIPKVRQKCGEPLVNLLHELIINSFDIVHDISLGTGAIETWPVECSLLQDYSIPPPSEDQSASPTEKTDQSIVTEDTVDRPKTSNETPKISKTVKSNSKESLFLSWKIILFSFISILILK